MTWIGRKKIAFIPLHRVSSGLADVDATVLPMEFAGGRTDAANVPTIDVVLIRSVEDAALICAQRHFLDIKGARREELRSSTGSGDRVEVVPTVFLAREDYAACIGELQRLKRKQRQRIFHRVTAVKELSTFTALRVCNPKRPRSRELRNERPFEFDSGLANKHNLFAVR